MRKSAKEWNIQKAESSLMQNHYYESQAALLSKEPDESFQHQSLTSLPIKYFPRKVSR